MRALRNNKSQLKKIYKTHPHNFVFQSIVEGNTPGKVFVDDEENISVFLILEGNSVYFGGEVENKETYKEVISFFKENFLCEERRSNLEVIKINYYPEVWATELIEGLKEFNFGFYDRSLFKQDLQHVPTLDREDVTLIIKAIDEDVLSNASLGNINSLKDEVMGMWGSTDIFIKNGFGYCAIKEENIISWCTAEYVSENHCGIGIETIEEYKGKGVATLIANEFLKKCLILNITPHWDSWKRNIPSIRVAEKNEFKKICDYKIGIIEFE